MIKTGIDIVEINRFAEMKNLDSFLEKVFSRRERGYFSEKSNSYESIAGHFAAKEAFSKYMGTGLRGFSWRDIEVVHDELSKPYIRFMGKDAGVDLSISHSKTHAVAVVCGAQSHLDGEKADHIKEYRALLPKRGNDINKGDCGKVFIVAGSKGMTGAAALCARAALRSGSGLVTVGTAESEQPVLAIKLTEAMTLALPAENGIISKDAISDIVNRALLSNVCAFGPGLGRGKDIAKIAEAVLETGKPLVIDADGLNAIGENIDVLKKNHGDVVLTPHPGEMARLCGKTIDEIQSSRSEAAAEFAKQTNCTVVLKGKNTVVASPRGEVHINPTGNNGMATGGTGDVLTGVIAAFMGQGLSGFNAAVLGTFIHGLAGDIARVEVGTFGMTAGDVVEKIPQAILRLQGVMNFNE